MPNLTPSVRAKLVSAGLDPDTYTNPRQSLPPLRDRIAKLERYVRTHPNSPKASHYRARLTELRKLEGRADG